MRRSIVAVILAGLTACQSAPVPVPAAAPLVDVPEQFEQRMSFTLTHLNGRAVPTPYKDPRGAYSLISGELIFNSDRRMWLNIELEGTGDYASGPTGRKALATRYRRVGPDSLVFPADSAGSVPEFVGRIRGSELLIVASPTRSSRVVSVARDWGGIHTWRFILSSR
jgi:hypothetical protein